MRNGQRQELLAPTSTVRTEPIEAGGNDPIHRQLSRRLKPRSFLFPDGGPARGAQQRHPAFAPLFFGSPASVANQPKRLFPATEYGFEAIHLPVGAVLVPAHALDCFVVGAPRLEPLGLDFASTAFVLHGPPGSVRVSETLQIAQPLRPIRTVGASYAWSIKERKGLRAVDCDRDELEPAVDVSPAGGVPVIREATGSRSLRSQFNRSPLRCTPGHHRLERFPRDNAPSAELRAHQPPDAEPMAHR
jgi:hypothetical protein